ncbi:hypothetical protein, partial [Parasutterella excrementihominis]|uniref:hypothetical protein n=1 Tax=Parasutterella excrementihominis TaxID=487175 RepID=UPI00272E068F
MKRENGILFPSVIDTLFQYYGPFGDDACFSSAPLRDFSLKVLYSAASRLSGPGDTTLIVENGKHIPY